jgi:hypothetical protein
MSELPRVQPTAPVPPIQPLRPTRETGREPRRPRPESRKKPARRESDADAPGSEAESDVLPDDEHGPDGGPDASDPPMPAHVDLRV